MAATTAHLWVAISSHGFGHLAQVAPVLNALIRRRPTLRLSIQCALPETVLRARIQGDFTHIPEPADSGLVMANALEVQIAESLEAYRVFHADWPARLERQQTLLKRSAVDLILADIPYLPLAAGARLGIPSVALCSLNWAAILQAYAEHAPDLEALCAVMLEAYASAELFLCPAPSLPMPQLPNTHAIGPIADVGRNRRPELNVRLALAGTETLIIAALGGVDMPLPMARWPALPGVCWLIPASWSVARSDVRYREALADMGFVDLVRSCDILLTKPGYGGFTEAVCNGKPVLFVERDDWPETPWLVKWLLANGNAQWISRHSLETGELAPALRALQSQPSKPALAPSGIDAAVACLERYLPAQPS